MKNWVVMILCWYVQDLVQLVMTQTFLAPEVFLLSLIWCATGEDPGYSAKWTAAALAGGFLMDFRWTGIPGLSGSLYVLALLAARYFWFQIPVASRHMLPYVLINAVVCAVLSLIRLLLWNSDVLAHRFFIVLGTQWLLTAIMLILFGLLRAYSYEKQQI
jgi:hypothetical protein